MCGIFGIVAGAGSSLEVNAIGRATNLLFKLSESRGKEASGLVLRMGNSIYVYKEAVRASKLICSSEYVRLMDKFVGDSKPLAIMGHSRLVTNGLQETNSNNQPVVKDGVVGIHNGIIVNADDLWKATGLKREYEVDTEIILALAGKFLKDGRSLPAALRAIFASIRGAASIGLLFDNLDILALATNTGSLYCYAGSGIFVFASEKYMLAELARKMPRFCADSGITQLEPRNGLCVSLSALHVAPFSLTDASDAQSLGCGAGKDVRIIDLSPRGSLPPRSTTCRLSSETRRAMEQVWERIYSGKTDIRRCARCVLPDTMPYIDFDADGVCNICRTHGEFKIKGPEALEAAVAGYRSAGNDPDCLVALSVGRDSSFGLHYVKNVLGMKPLAFTYDWGMVTDLARRNIARLCGKLGVEHILVSADIEAKRRNVRKNVAAWLRKPDLGMVPLFMAGDKQFFLWAHRLRRQTGIKLFIFCAGNQFEETLFKYGFCGISEAHTRYTLTNISLIKKLKLFWHYAKQCAGNPRYLNSSISDTMSAFYSTYLLRDDYLYLFHYLPWDENKIISVLRAEYDWEMAPDTKSTWRIGDGTAPFYNYIYLSVAGLTEHDTFRSNQIREGMLSRSEALALLKDDNRPRFDAIEWYAQTIGFDFNRASAIIEALPKLYREEAV